MHRGKQPNASGKGAAGKVEPRAQEGNAGDPAGGAPGGSAGTTAGGRAVVAGDGLAERVARRVRAVVPEVLRRFRDSAGERNAVTLQVEQGRAPVDIDNPTRVRQRMEHLGTDESSARRVVRESRDAVRRGEPPRAPVPKLLGIERVIRRSNLVSVGFLARAAERARSVGCVRLGSRRIGTGFLVTGTGLLMTNNHVIADADQARQGSVEFDFEEDPSSGGLKPSQVFALDPDTFFLTSPADDLDYTLVAVRPQSTTGAALTTYDFLELQPATGKVLRGEPLNIIQHPDGRPKELAIQENLLTALLPKFLHYETDTEPGSSGSPVFNNDWEVVCLHHSGVPRMNPAGDPLDKRGNVWDGIDDADIDWVGNEGVRISRIVADVWRRLDAGGGSDSPLMSGFPRPVANPSDQEEQARAAEPGSPRFPQKRGGDPADPGAPGARAGRGGLGAAEPPIRIDAAAAQGAGAAATWTIPLHVSIQVGQPQMNGGAGHNAGHRDAGRAGAVPGGGGTGGPAGDRGGGGGGGGGGDPDVAEGLRQLERARTRIYYDRARDEQEREAYYADVNPDDPDLRGDLARLITGTHRNQLAYKPARVVHLYAWVDLQRNKMVRSIYSDTEYDPASFIREDFELERRREARVAERRLQEANVSDEALAAFMADLEAREPFNCEHVVPQSWFGKAAPMQGDLHHLFSCEADCNSYRSNHPYADFGTFDPADERVRPSCGDLQGDHFEPFKGKGKVARATLYFILRYPGRFNKTGQAYTKAQIRTLVEWNEKVPVTEHELHRNQAIFEIQGNRNPFIDHPGWAAAAF